VRITLRSSPSRRRLSPRLAVGAAALALVLCACFPTVTIETDVPSGAVVALRPQSSGVILFVRVPADRPSGGIEVVEASGRTFRVPPGHYPPPGQCRVWDPDLPPGRQSPPGPCDVLERQVPPGSYLIYG
jgi:hypothetical protein